MGRRISPLAARKMFRGRSLFMIRNQKTLNMGREEKMQKDQPNIVEKAKHLLKATARHVADGMKEVSKNQLDTRLSICNECDLRDGRTCTHPECGCSLIRKALWHSEDCPEGKWPKI